MAENIKLNKEVFNKRDYVKAIDTSFKELGVVRTEEEATASEEAGIDLLINNFKNTNN